MGQLVRFDIDEIKHKASLYERGSRRLICSCCGLREFGVLVRMKDPEKKDYLVCHKCIVKLALGIRIDHEDGKRVLSLDDVPAKIVYQTKKRGKPGRKAKPGPKPKKKKKTTKKRTTKKKEIKPFIKHETPSEPTVYLGVDDGKTKATYVG